MLLPLAGGAEVCIGIQPRRGRPILMSCRRILFTSPGSMKGLGLTVVTILLVPSLVALCLAIQVRSTLLSPRFVAAQLSRLDLSALFEQAAGSAVDAVPRECRGTRSGG